ncbi:uncharacterized protein LOC106468391 [Limulus polyphemus]|uniref:Uncharacterized protein LOC106468391 n=1 Tax=Limulus polyphemus TaxID=6850 RepID=A0ABM1BLA1_LIMPO|nr:uncharacterized protein LOC106468391 [Limulus polyphemus]
MNARALGILNLYAKRYTSNVENTKKKQVQKLHKLTKKDKPTISNAVHSFSSGHLSGTENEINLDLNFAIEASTLPIFGIDATLESGAQKPPKSTADQFRHPTYTSLRNANEPKPNITKHEYSTLKRLKQDNTIKIPPADKGNSIVIPHLNDYDTKIKQLLDGHQYKKCIDDPTEKIERLINRTIKKQNLVNENLAKNQR